MRRRVLLSIVLIAVVAVPVVVLGQEAEWREIVSSHRLQRHGTHEVRVRLRQTGERSCMLGNCRVNLEVEVEHGELPSQQLRYFYADGQDREPGCSRRHRDRLFRDWTEAEIAPARYEDRPACGVGVTLEDHNIEDWVIRRTRPVPEEDAGDS